LTNPFQNEVQKNVDPKKKAVRRMRLVYYVHYIRTIKYNPVAGTLMKLTTIIINVAWTLTFGGDVEMEEECRTFEIKFQGL